MGPEQHQLDTRATPGTDGLQLVFPGDADSVRRALKAAMEAFREMRLDATVLGTVEIVLAEALNNVVEHAYAGRDRGIVDLAVDRSATALSFRIVDDGLAMPDGDAPPGHAQEIDVATDDLPEGGFGWFLIRELTQDLSYRRIGRHNELTFRIGLDAPAPNA